MAVPRYSLQTILDQRQRAKEDAKKAFAGAIRQLDAEQLRLKEMEARREALVTEHSESLSHLYDPDQDGMLSIPLLDSRRNGIRFLQERIELQKKAIVAQQETVSQAEKEVERKQAELVEADKGLKAIEKHRENWLAEVKREAAQKEQKLGEEITSARFVRDAAEQAEEEPE